MNNKRSSLTIMMLWCAGVALALTMLASLGGCATFSGAEDRDARFSAQDAVYEANSNLNIALVAAIQYARLPRCELNPDLVICSDQQVVDKIVAYQNAAAKALDDAEAVARAENSTKEQISPKMTALSTAMTALTSAVSALPRLK